MKITRVLKQRDCWWSFHCYKSLWKLSIPHLNWKVFWSKYGLAGLNENISVSTSLLFISVPGFDNSYPHCYELIQLPVLLLIGIIFKVSALSGIGREQRKHFLSPSSPIFYKQWQSASHIDMVFTWTTMIFEGYWVAYFGRTYFFIANSCVENDRALIVIRRWPIKDIQLTEELLSSGGSSDSRVKS